MEPASSSGRKAPRIPTIMALELDLGRLADLPGYQGGGIGADCNGYPQNGVRYDTPDLVGLQRLGGFYGEDDVWDVAVKYAADWNSIKVSAAAGYTQPTDEGCTAGRRLPWRGADLRQRLARGPGGGGAPFQNFRRTCQLFQVGASIMHVPSGLFAYGLYQHDEKDGTQFRTSLSTSRASD